MSKFDDIINTHRGTLSEAVPQMATTTATTPTKPASPASPTQPAASAAPQAGSQQPEQQATQNPYSALDNLTGDELYKHLTTALGDESASQELLNRVIQSIGSQQPAQQTQTA